MDSVADSVVFISRERMSQRQFADWINGPEARDCAHYELLDGFVVREPPAAWPHGEIAATILAKLSTHVRQRQLGRVFDSSQGFELPSGDTLEPDISFVSEERWAAGSPERGKFLQLVPDFVIEVLSPGTAALDRNEKKRIYAINGVREYWLVDDATRSITRFVRGAREFDPPEVFAETQDIDSPTAVGFEFKVADVFPE